MTKPLTLFALSIACGMSSPPAVANNDFLTCREIKNPGLFNFSHIFIKDVLGDYLLNNMTPKSLCTSSTVIDDKGGGNTLFDVTHVKEQQYVCYSIDHSSYNGKPATVHYQNTFKDEDVDVHRPDSVCVPSTLAF